MRPTETLMHEHEIILMVLDAAEREVRRMQETDAVRTERLEQMVDFFRNFADRCHHAKEEKLLFQAMAQRGIPVAGGPIGVMLAEHDQGRAYVRTIAEEGARYAAGDLADSKPLVEAVKGYVTLLRQHIFKEDQILYPMAEQVLPVEAQHNLAQAFERVGREEMGPGEHERYHALIETLERALPN